MNSAHKEVSVLTVIKSMVVVVVRLVSLLSYRC